MNASDQTDYNFNDLFSEKSNAPGTLIIVCGFDGSGKTTQIRLLSEKLSARGHKVIVTKQPTDWYRNEPRVRLFLDEGYERKNARTIALLAAADRLMHVSDIINPALRTGSIVICDRYVFSSLALFAHRGVERDFILQINRGIPRPDYTIYLDVSTSILLERLRQRDGQKLKYEERSIDTIDAIKKEFQKINNLFSVIDGSQDPLIVSREIDNVCSKLFYDNTCSFSNINLDESLKSRASN